jgi:predicted HTH transcriptional regulator
MIEAAASMYCKPEIHFFSHKRIVDGKTILEVKIEASENKPHFANDDSGKWLAYHRIKDNNFLASYILLQVWKRSRREQGTFIEYTENEKRVLEILYVKGPIDFQELKNDFPQRKRNLEQILINLISLKAIKMEFIEDSILFSSTRL